ncbi:HAD family hydrolase [Melissospora conviva]|uniref:HAD family hydrolase n=1 Tax=Melissospora conviva TaxID=3388432 RepID=UPI003C1CF062
MNAQLGELLGRSTALLLDFDGPVCDIFAGYPAPRIAAELVELLHRLDVDVPAEVAQETDPLEVLRWAGGTGEPSVVVAVEDALCAAELRAAASSEPTPYGREVIVAAKQAGMPVAIVSNNSAPAIASYLAAHRLAGHVAAVVGRAHAEPARMKPNPEPILSAASALAADPGRCVLVGDSLSDIEGAAAAGVPVIGYANKAHKHQQFEAAGADAVIGSMRDVAALLLG